MLRNFLLLLFCVTATRQQVADSIFFRDDTLEIGSACRTEKEIGQCVLGKNCEDPFGDSNNERPSICFFENHMPVVCCPRRKVIVGDDSLSDSNLFDDDFQATIGEKWTGPLTPAPNETEKTTIPPPSSTSPPTTSSSPLPISDLLHTISSIATSETTTTKIALEPELLSLDDAPASAKPLRISEKMCQEYSQNYTSELFVRQNLFLTIELVSEGAPAELGEFPHVAAIGSLNPDDENDITWFCGGSLISDQYILTAAHCMVNNTPNIVRLGDLDLTTDTDDAPVIDFAIEDITLHPSYKSNSMNDDIALIKLNETVEFSKLIRPACLNQNSGDNITAPTTIYGWGHTTYAEKLNTPALQKMTLTIYKEDQCNPFYKEILRESQLCAGDTQGLKDVCQADSGGPITTDTYISDQYIRRFTILGVTSFASKCKSETPALFTKVSSYLDWIEGIVWKS